MLGFAPTAATPTARANSAFIISDGCALAGLGGISESAVTQFAASILIGGSGGVSGFGGSIFAISISLAEVGSVSDSAIYAANVAITLAGVGAVSAANINRAVAALSIASVGAVSPTATRIIPVSTSIGETGAASAANTAQFVGQVNIAESGALLGAASLASNLSIPVVVNLDAAALSILTALAAAELDAALAAIVLSQVYRPNIINLTGAATLIIALTGEKT